MNTARTAGTIAVLAILGLGIYACHTFYNRPAGLPAVTGSVNTQIAPAFAAMPDPYEFTASILKAQNPVDPTPSPIMVASVKLMNYTTANPFDLGHKLLRRGREAASPSSPAGKPRRTCACDPPSNLTWRPPDLQPILLRLA